MGHRPSSALALASLLVIGFALAGCGAPCPEACRHLMNDCGILDHWPDVDACLTECEGVRTTLMDADERQAYDRQVRCLWGSQCDELMEQPGLCGEDGIVP